MKNRETVTRSARIVFGDDGVVRITVHAGADMTLADAQENLRLALSGAGGPVPLLVDISRIRSLAPAARRHFHDPEGARAHRALALVVGSRVARVIGNLFQAAGRGAPTRMFNSEADALAWLREHPGEPAPR
jgi:hypothetical protein